MDSDMHDKNRDPSRLIVDFIPALPVGRALDIACGEGRNAIYLAREGFDVDAIDKSDAALEKGRAAAGGFKINFIAADLEAFQIAENSYDLIINFNYLQRTIAPKINRGLKAGGYIVFETYTLEQQQFGRPTNPEFLLKPNELLTMFKDLHIIYYREGVVEEGGRKKGIASLVGRKLES